MSDLTERLQSAAHVSFGSRPSKRLSRFLGLSQRHAQYLLSGGELPTEEQVALTEAEASLVAELKPRQRLIDLVTSWRSHGMHDEAIAAAIADAYEAAFDRPVS